MALIDSALAAWISFHSSLGVDLELFFSEGVSGETLEQTEVALGYKLPDDLRALYGKTNGQRTSLDESQEHLNGVVWAPMFGHFYFYSLEKALEEYEVLSQMYLSDPELMESEWDVRGDDPVRAVYGDHKRFPFAGDDNGNMYMVDMNPPANGTVGQVIIQGSDQSKISVLSSSVAQFMIDASSNLDPSDIRRKSQLEPATPSARMQLLYFEMDWLERPDYIDNEISSSINKDEDLKLKTERRNYVRWLEEKGFEHDSLSSKKMDMLAGMIDSTLTNGIDDFPAIEEDVNHFISQVLIQRNVTHVPDYEYTDQLKTQIIELSVKSLRDFVEYQFERGKWLKDDSERIYKAIDLIRKPYSDDDVQIMESLLER